MDRDKLVKAFGELMVASLAQQSEIDALKRTVAALEARIPKDANAKVESSK